MAAQRGKDMLLKIRETPGDSYETVAGLRTRRFVLNQQVIDITDSESAGRWRELLGGSGIRRASLSASGIFKDKPSDAKVWDLFFASAAADTELIVPDFGALSGGFMITSLEYAGNHDSEVTFDIALESAGAIAFEAAQ